MGLDSPQWAEFRIMHLYSPLWVDSTLCAYVPHYGLIPHYVLKFPLWVSQLLGGKTDSGIIVIMMKSSYTFRSVLQEL